MPRIPFLPVHILSSLSVCLNILLQEALSWFDWVPSNLHFSELSHLLVLPTHLLWSFLLSDSPQPLSFVLGCHTEGCMCYIYLHVAEKEDGTGIFSSFFLFVLYLDASYQRVRQNLFPTYCEFWGSVAQNRVISSWWVLYMKLMHYVSSNISLPKKSQPSLKLSWSLWQWNSVTEQSAPLYNLPVVKLMKCPFVANRERAVVKTTGRWRHRVHISALTGGQDRDTAVASAAPHWAVSTRVGCPAHGCTPESSTFGSTTKTMLENWGRDFGDKNEEMDLHFFSCGLACSMFTAFVVVFVVVLKILKFSDSFWQDLRFSFLYILIKINVKL